jgi:hypothetical protein
MGRRRGRGAKWVRSTEYSAGARPVGDQGVERVASKLRSGGGGIDSLQSYRTELSAILFVRDNIRKCMAYGTVFRASEASCSVLIPFGSPFRHTLGLMVKTGISTQHWVP